MSVIPNDFQDLFEKRTFAHLSTLLPDGSPHSTPVWIDYDAEVDRVRINTERGRQKERNVRDDPRVAISMTDPENPYRMLMIRGEVDEITTEGAREHLDQLSKRYTDENEYPNPIQTERILLLIRPDHVSRFEP